MYKHVLVRAETKQSLLSGFTSENADIKIFKPKQPFTDRFAALDYLQLRLKQLERYKAMAVPVMLPITPEYNRKLEESQELIDRLSKTPESWHKQREKIEKQIVALSSTLRYLEHEEHESRALHWAIYWTEENNEQYGQYRTQVQ